MTREAPSPDRLRVDALQAWVDWCAKNGPKIDAIIGFQFARNPDRQPYDGEPWPLEQTKAALAAAPAPAAPTLRAQVEALRCDEDAAFKDAGREAGFHAAGYNCAIDDVLALLSPASEPAPKAEENDGE